MAKETDDTYFEKDKTVEKQEKVNQPKGAPIAPSEAGNNVSRETLSHQWQENSPAINTNTIAGYGTQTNVVSDLAAQRKKAEEEPEEKKKPVVSEADYERRTKLDVSNPEYINPSLEHNDKVK